MTRTKYSAQHPQLYCEIGHSASILYIGFPCTIGTFVYMGIYCTNSLYVYAMVGDPSLSQHGGQAYPCTNAEGPFIAYPCTNAEGLFITDSDKRLSHSLPFNFLSPLHILSNFSPPLKKTHTIPAYVQQQDSRSGCTHTHNLCLRIATGQPVRVHTHIHTTPAYVL